MSDPSKTAEFNKAKQVELRDRLTEYNGLAYKTPSIGQLNYLFDKFIRRVEVAYQKFSPPNPPPLQYCTNDVITLVESVWKRKIYFRVFHPGVNGMNELKVAALNCFWLLKIQPIFTGARSSDSTNKLNSKIALYLLLNGVHSYVVGMNDKAKKSGANRRYRMNINQSILEGLHRSFRFRDWSKEALMDLAEGLVIIETVK